MDIGTLFLPNWEGGEKTFRIGKAVKKNFHRLLPCFIKNSKLPACHKFFFPEYQLPASYHPFFSCNANFIPCFSQSLVGIPSFLLLTMDPPIAGQFFNTFNDLFAAVQSHARQTGWAVIKTRASNRRADGNYYKYDLACDRGVDTHEMRSTGRREASSRKEGCPWRGIAAARKSDGDRWKYETINFTYNHPPSLDASVHSMHRRLTDEERGALERHTQAGSCLYVITSDLRAKNQA